MQTPSRWGFTLHNVPQCETFVLRYQHVGIQEALWTQHEPQSTQHESQSTQCHPQCEEMEYCLRWAISRWHCIGHVDFMLFVSCLLALGSQCRTRFLVEYGLYRFLMLMYNVHRRYHSQWLLNAIKFLETYYQQKVIMYSPRDFPKPWHLTSIVYFPFQDCIICFITFKNYYL